MKRYRITKTTIDCPTIIINTNGHYSVKEIKELLIQSGRNIISKREALSRLFMDSPNMGFAFVLETKDTYSLTVAKLYRSVDVGTILIVTSDKDLLTEYEGIAMQHNIFEKEHELV